MSVALPWPLPSSQDMCEAWSVLVANKNTVGKKWVGKADYMAAEIWLDRATEQAEGTFNRNLAFKEVVLAATKFVVIFVVTRMNNISQYRIHRGIFFFRFKLQ